MKESVNNKYFPVSLMKVGFAANILEWYEFAIYNYLVIIMGENFLATDHPTIKTIRSYALFSVGHLARPVGSLFYGYLGSEISYSYVLKRSLLTMATYSVD